MQSTEISVKNLFICLLLTGMLFTSCQEDRAVKTEVAGTGAAVTPIPAPVTVSDKDLQMTKVERGAYLVNAIGCDDCHSPKKMSPQGPEIIEELRLSGHPANQPLAKITDPAVLKDYMLFSPALTAAIGPWGTSFAANLTPDETGLGTWTEAQFLKAIKEGKLKGLDNTRPLLPPMPWTMYRNLNDNDLKSIFAYLKTLKPVKNVVPSPIFPAG